MTTFNTIIEEENTPDTEEDIVEEIALTITRSESGNFDANHEWVKQKIDTLLTSRDTYWKERVRKEFKDHYWDSLEKDKDILMLHVDTLLDNLK